MILTVGGIQKSVRVGQVVYAPETTPSENSNARVSCSTPELSITVSGSSGIASIILSTDGACTVTVANIIRSAADVDGAEGTVAYAPTVIEYEGWPKSELSDDIGIDLASIRSTIEYFYNGETVYNGHDSDADCDVWDYLGGWAIKTCQWVDSTSGPNSIVVQGHGTFTHGILGNSAYHWQESTFKGVPGNYFYTCRHAEVHLSFTRWSCSGGRDRID